MVKLTQLVPASDDEIHEIASNFFYNDITKLKDFSFQSVIPYLEQMDFDMDDIYRLNDLAKNTRLSLGPITQ